MTNINNSQVIELSQIRTDHRIFQRVRNKKANSNQKKFMNREGVIKMKNRRE